MSPASNPVNQCAMDRWSPIAHRPRFREAVIRAQVRLDGASPTTEAELAVISESIEIKVLIVDFLIFSVDSDFLDRFVEL